MTLKWTSKNATYASTASGDKGPASGSLKDKPTETTTYIKRVYGPGGEGYCTRTVEVGKDETPTEKVVTNFFDLGRIGSAVVSNMAAAAEAYFGLFGVTFGD